MTAPNNLFILDKVKLSELCNGDMLALADRLGDYMVRLAEQWEQMKAYASSRNTGELLKLIRAVATASTENGADQLASHMNEIDAAFRSGDSDEAFRKIANALPIIDATRDAVAEYSTMTFH